MLEMLNWQGVLVGLLAFLAIGVCHPLVIKAEYFFGKKIAWLFLLLGIVIAGLSLFPQNTFISIALGVIGFSFLWSAHEVVQQHKRVLWGRAKMNPKRKNEYY